MFYFCEDFTYLLENVLVTGSSPTGPGKELPGLAVLAAGYASSLKSFFLVIFLSKMFLCRISLCSFSALFY